MTNCFDGKHWRFQQIRYHVINKSGILIECLYNIVVIHISESQIWRLPIWYQALSDQEKSEIDMGKLVTETHKLNWILLNGHLIHLLQLASTPFWQEEPFISVIYRIWREQVCQVHHTPFFFLVKTRHHQRESRIIPLHINIINE